jgi:two-component system, cell cycle sensor histidine kinase and response regulator CckA
MMRAEVSPATSTSVRLGEASVLVVDDEAAIRHFAARILREEGFGVHEAPDGAAALDLIRQGAIDPAVVLSDIVMPKLDGVQLVRSLSALKPGLPILLMSGYGPVELAQRGMPGLCGVLAKPFLPELLVAEVRRCIRG